MRFTGCGKRGWDKTRLHLERGRHSFLWSSDELSKPTCKEFGAQNFKQIEIFLSPSLSVSNCPGDLTESCYTRCDFRSVVSGFNNVFIFIAVIFGWLGILQSLVVALPAEAAACTQWWERCEDKRDLEMEMSAWSLWDSLRASSELPWKPSQECLAFPSLQTRSLTAPHHKHLPSGAARELNRRQDTGEKEGGGKELLGHVKYVSKWGNSG